MVDLSGQHVGHRLDAPVRMPGETGKVILRILRLEVVEEEKRIDVLEGGRGDAPPEPDTGTLNDRLRLDDAQHRAGFDSHGDSLVWIAATQ